jgi:hypothetical protein
MDAKTVIRTVIDNSAMIVNLYLNDLSDQEMLHRPAPDANHIKWQLGHLIQSEHQMLEGCFPGQMPNLPVGFKERYSREHCRSDEADQFDSKDRLLDLYRQQREATLKLLDQVTPEDLDRPGPESMRSYVPTVASAFLMQDVHWTMHAGQWAVIRRQLGRPAIF